LLAHTKKINAPHTHLKHPSQPQPAVVCRQEALARAHKKRSTRPTRTSNTHHSHSLQLSADKKLAHTRRDQRAPHAPQTPIPATACGCLPTRSSCSRTQEEINAPHTHLKHPSQPQPAVVCRQEAFACIHGAIVHWGGRVWDGVHLQACGEVTKSCAIAHEGHSP